jgi:hypothetical protein
MEDAVAFGGERDGGHVGGYLRVGRMGGGHRTPLKFMYNDVLYAEVAKGKKMARRRMLQSNEVKVATCLYKLRQPLALSSFRARFASVNREVTVVGFLGQSE